MGQNLEVFRCLDSLIAILAKDAQVRAFLVKFATQISGGPSAKLRSFSRVGAEFSGTIMA